MLFNSFQFVLFFPTVTVLYFLLPHKFRWGLLLMASCIFYMAFIPVYIFVLALTIVIDYFAGIWIEDSYSHRKKYYLVISIISTCLVLFAFKYFNFFNSSFASIAQFFHLNYPIEMLNIILPIGLSFHTFQSLSYVIEVYRGNQKAERHFGIYALYVMFYPQLVAGPIERPQNLLHQFREYHSFDYTRVTDGLKLMAWGMFKKVVIADRLAILVNQVYENPGDYQGLALIIATVFFAFQIYCDFSGYSDIAIGAAQVMGFKLMKNFNRPYSSKSISEFWKRWHISLSTWFKDYLYISLGGNRVPKIRWYFNLFFTFLISGLWHGANWTFVIWGALNGFYLVFALFLKQIITKFPRFHGITKFPVLNSYLQVAVTFSLVCFGWIFFRSKNLDDAFYIVSHLFSDIQNSFNFRYLSDFISQTGFSKAEFLLAIILIILMETVHFLQRTTSLRTFISKKHFWLRWSVYYAIIFIIIFFGVYGNNEFIYFQF